MCVCVQKRLRESSVLKKEPAEDFNDARCASAGTELYLRSHAALLITLIVSRRGVPTDPRWMMECIKSVAMDGIIITEWSRAYFSYFIVTSGFAVAGRRRRRRDSLRNAFPLLHCNYTVGSQSVCVHNYKYS
jgi:hypothetical protein